MLAEAIATVSASLEERVEKDSSREQLKNDLEDLYYLSVRNHYSALKIDPLSADAKAYTGIFGGKGRYVEEVFYLALSDLSVYHEHGLQGETKAWEGPEEI